jgi:outer membrane protein
MKNIKFLPVLFLFLIGCKNEPKIVFVQTQILIEEFNMTKDLNKDLNNTLNPKKMRLDSLNLELGLLSNEIKSEKDLVSDPRFTSKRDEFQYLLENFENEKSTMTQQYHQQVVTQLNQYLQEFGKEKNYDVILGATGDGSIMYGKEELNVTEEALEFINAKYKGAIK